MASERARDHEHEVRPVRDPPAPVPVEAPGFAGELLRLQGTAGNTTVVRMLRESGLLPAPPDPGEEVARRIRGRLGGGEELPAEVRARVAPAVDAPLGPVRVHRDAEAASLAKDLGARAFTTGTDIFFGAGSYDPGTRQGAELLAHELTHTTQPATAPGTGGALRVSDPRDPTELAAEAASRRVAAPSRDTPSSDAPAVDAPGADTPAAGASRPGAPGGVSVARAPLRVAREPAPGAPAVPEQYASLTAPPSLSKDDTRMLRQVTGGADLVELIQQRNAIRSQLAAPSPPSNDPLDGGVPGGASYDPDQMRAQEQELTNRIDPQLAQLGIGSDTELLDLVRTAFPKRFLAEAGTVALEMLATNRAQANAELTRYSGQVCTPDIDGLLAADRALAELDPAPVQISILAAESALSTYGPAAGALTPEQFATLVPENERSVMDDIAHLDENRRQLEQRTAIYDNARYGYGRTYPILLDSQYHPGTYSSAPPDQLAALVAQPVKEIVANIDRVEQAIRHDDLKIWNMRDVLQITLQRLHVTHPVLLRSIEAQIQAVQADEVFLGWVTAALAITTSVVAGMLFTPAAGAAVAALWTAAAVPGHVREMLDETAANRVALDARVADLSLNEPTIAWLLLDAVSLGLDLAAVASALRPTARLLVAQADGVALQAFRRAALDASIDPATADQLVVRAAAHLGIAAAGTQSAAGRLAFVAQELADLNLSEDALARIAAKGADVGQVKGAIVEELMNAKVARDLASGSAPALGAPETAGLEFIEGFRIRDLKNAELTDGMVVRRLPDGSLEITSVLESKAGRASLRELHRRSGGIDDVREFVSSVIDDDPSVVAGALRRAGLDKDAEIAARGSKRLSDKAFDAAAADKEVRRTANQSELGGQVRGDVERLDANADAGPQEILVDGVPTKVRFSPTGTRFVGTVPRDVPTGAATRSLQGQGFSFQAMPVDVTDADIGARAARIAENARTATTPTVPATP